MDDLLTTTTGMDTDASTTYQRCTWSRTSRDQYRSHLRHTSLKRF